MNRQGQGKPLYSISIIRNYLEYLHAFYPHLSHDTILRHAGITRYQLDDPGYFYDQDTSDRFHEILQILTHNPDLSRDAGRYTVSSKAYKFIRTYIRGFIGPESAYNLLPKIHAKVSKGASLTVRELSRGKLEVVVTPCEGVNEKPYQCENRVGQFEAIAAGFTGTYAQVQHPECFHRGDSRCRYILAWKEPLFLKLGRYRNYLLIFSVLACLAMYRYLTGTEMIHVSAALSSLVLGLTFAGWFLEKSDYRKQLADQSKAADLLITESNARYNDARLIQDLGQAISRTLDTDTILDTVTHTLRERLDYDRGIILLADDEKTRLVFKTGYGLIDEQERFLRENSLRLDKPDPKGPFVTSYQERKPFLVDDVSSLSQDLSDQSMEMLQLSRSGSFICVPIVYEDEALGILIVDRSISSIPLRQNDLNLLLGVAPQIAISISNARTFEKLQEEEQHYRDLVESSGSIIIRMDPEGRIKFANRYALQFYGYSLEEVLHRDIREFIVSASHTGGTNLAPRIDRFLKDPETFTTGKTETLRKSGKPAYVYWSTKGIRNRQGDLVEILCVGNDITEWMRAEEEKSELEESLIKSQKMEAIGTLAGGVAHDLNNILSGLTSYPDLLLIDMPEDDPYRKALTTIKRSGERAAAIVQDLLTLARRGVSISNPVDLNRIIQDYFESPEYLKMHSFHTNVNFTIRLDPDIKPILGSEIHLMKSIMNLVNNAAEALQDKGTVTVSTSSAYMDRTIKGDGKVPAGEYVVLTVSDTGIGISEEDQQKIFEPFFTKKKMGKSGTGLGMTVVWSTVKDHKGYIEIESEKGKGTTFNIYFPVTTRKLKENGIDRIDMYQGTERVMVVDDEEYQRDLTMEVLSRLGYQVDAASSGEEALQKMQSRPADLLILDMMMDGIDGLDTYKGALELQQKQKALIVSGYSETERVKEALRLGAGGYIKKPYALQDFARAVRRELDKKVH